MESFYVLYVVNELLMFWVNKILIWDLGGVVLLKSTGIKKTNIVFKEPL